MPKQRLKRIQGGRLVKQALWSAAFPCDTPKARAEKARCTTMARQALNDKAAWEKLKMILASNFDYQDLMITLTYDDNHLPPNIIAARKLLKKFLGQLREYRRCRGQELRYVYVTENVHGDGRIHHHLVISGTGQDYDIIRSLWIYGENLEFSRVESWGYEELAKYLTKEPRKYGRNCVGERMWTPSRNLQKPVVHPTEWVSENVRLELPTNAYKLKSNSFENEWGSFSYMEYLLPPEPKQQRTRPKARKLKTALSFSGLEHCITNGKG